MSYAGPEQEKPPFEAWCRRIVEYSLGWSIGELERAAITALPTSAWSPAIDADGGVRDGAQVAELTGLPHLDIWPAGMRGGHRAPGTPAPRRAVVAVRRA